MSTNLDTNFDTNFDGELDERESDSVRPEKPKPTRAYFYPLPHYAQDRRHDPRSRDGANMIALPYSDGFLERFERTAMPGFYFVELRAGKQILGGDVHEVKPSGRIAEAAQKERHQHATVPAQAGQAEGAPAQAVNSVADTVRAVKDLTKELSPPVTQAAPFTAADIERIAGEAAARAVEQYKATQPAQPTAAPVDPFTVLERAMKLQGDIQKQVVASTPAPAQPAQQGDEFERVMSLFDRVEQLRERIEPPRSVDDEPSMLGKAVALMDSLGRNASSLAPLLVPLLPAQIQTMLGATGAADAMASSEAQPQPAGAQGQPQAGRLPQNEQEAFTLILHVVVADLVKGKRAGRAADLIEELILRFPALAPTVQELCKSNPVDVLAMLAKHSGRDDLPSFGHAFRYVENLQAELRGDDDEDEGAELSDAETAPNIVVMASERAS